MYFMYHITERSTVDGARCPALLPVRARGGRVPALDGRGSPRPLPPEHPRGPQQQAQSRI